LYHLFFASNHALGHKKMKEAMWRTDPDGEFRFADKTDPSQIVLLAEDPTEPLKRYLLQVFGNRRVTGGEVLQTVVDDTVFLDKHTRKALAAIERAGQLQVEELKESGQKRRKGTFPPDCVLTFA